MRIQPYETIARVRAQILHILYELGRYKHQFRLRFKGQYLRDAFTIEDYGIMDCAIIKMVPLSKKIEVCMKVNKHAMLLVATYNSKVSFYNAHHIFNVADLKKNLGRFSTVSLNWLWEWTGPVTSHPIPAPLNNLG